MNDAERVLIVSPVRNEAAHIERVVNAMALQTRPPDLWLVVDDSSDDGTPGILRSLAPGIPWMRIVDIPRTPVDKKDRLALALEAKAFNAALASADVADYTHIGKLDGDIELPENYFERLLAEMRSRPALGLVGGSLVEPTGPNGSWARITAPQYHVHGALKLYTTECFHAVGGIQERLGWDTIDETYARMRGFETWRDPRLVARHHRPGGSAGGKLRGRARHGECAYVARYPLPWVLVRSLKIGSKLSPRVISGVAFALGYVYAMARRMPRVEDPEFKRYVRREVRNRLPGWHRLRSGSSEEARRPTVALIASIGGHVDLLVAVRRAFADYNRVWLMESSSRASALMRDGECVELLPSYSRNPLRAKLLRNTATAARVLRTHRPDVIVTSGAGIAIPFSVLARAGGRKLFFVETMARIENPSRTGRLLSRLAERSLVQWEDLAGAYPRTTVCQPALLEGLAADADSGGMGTFVGLGTHVQPFDRLLSLIDDAVGAGLLPGPVTVQRGVSDYEPRNFPMGERWMSPDEIERSVHAARYVVCHAGSGIISLALRAGRRPLVLARSKCRGEHIDDHQHQIVRRLASMGLIVSLGDQISESDVEAADLPLPADAGDGDYPSVELALRTELERTLAA